MLVHSSLSLLFCFIPSQLERHVIPGLLSLYSNILFLLIRWKSGTRRTTMDMLMGKGKGRPSFLLLLRAVYRRTFASAARRAELRA